MTWQHLIDLLRGEMVGGIVGISLARLALAAILGGVIGLERELNHRPTGLRTNMFICVGAALFTLLSAALVGVPSDAARIAAKIVPGIVFIGAGSILHTRGLTSGITPAATLFVVASIGMAAGGGLYMTAVFATGVVLALFGLGHSEETFNLTVLLSSYEVTGASFEEISNEVSRILTGRGTRCGSTSRTNGAKALIHRPGSPRPSVGCAARRRAGGDLHAGRLPGLRRRG